MASLTLGGYDALRVVQHDIKFSLDVNTKLPTVRLRGVTAHVPSLDDAPANWTSTTQTLVEMDDSITAIIDSSTPYLWLPTKVCERFAEAFDLTWREDLGVYIFSEGRQYIQFQENNSLSLTFTVSSYDNTDNFGQPLDVPGVVNITLPATAFAHLLAYPFKNVIQWGDSRIPYFPLKRSTGQVNDNTYIIGRVFMQEAYIITTYDKGTFSLHQARFPENAASNYSLRTIERPDDSPFPEFSGDEVQGSKGLSTGSTVGIVLSAFACGSIIGMIVWCCCWRKRKKNNKGKTTEHSQETKEARTTTDDEQPQSPVRRMFTIIARRRKPRKPEAHEVHGNSSERAEVGADSQHQVFELPVPVDPVELDSRDVGDDETNLGTESSQLSPYELARRKLDRQLQGPVPTYTPPVEQGKSIRDAANVAHYRPSDEPSPASSPTYAQSDSLPVTLPSPMTPHIDWSSRHFDLPSPMTIPAQFFSSQHLPNPNGHDPAPSHSPVSPHSPHSPHSPKTFAPSSVSHSESNNVSPASPIGSLRMPPTPTIQRTPIDPSRIVCLGPLPEHIQPPTLRATPPTPIAVPGPAASNMDHHLHQYPDITPPSPTRSYRHSHGSNDSLGSNFTEEEEYRIRQAAGILAEPQQQQQHASIRPHHHHRSASEQTDGDSFPHSPLGLGRIDAATELIHVPQVADKRYSWEHDDDR